jgi:hypothetical protein
MSLKANYTKKDFNQLVDYLKSVIPELTPNWTDFLESDIGFALVKTFAYIGDMNNFYLDRQAAEAFLATCEYRDSAIVIAKALGYNPRGITSARTTVEVSLQSPYSESISIPAGTTVEIGGKVFTTSAPKESHRILA